MPPLTSAVGIAVAAPLLVVLWPLFVGLGLTEPSSEGDAAAGDVLAAPWIGALVFAALPSVEGVLLTLLLTADVGPLTSADVSFADFSLHPNATRSRH